jgi:CO dehydrogenase maturation factor
MGYTIAIAGKGGTGKTTVAALLVRIIKEKNLGSLLAVDADPNSNLGEFLGVESRENIGGIIDEIAANPAKVPAGMPKDRFVEYRIQAAIEERDGFDILTMGRPEGPGCYCYANNVLRNILSKLIKNYDYIVIDNEAGLEHLSRRTTRAADVLLIISDDSAAGIRTARRIYGLVRELNIKTGKNFLIINRSGIKPRESLEGVEYLGSIPQDERIQRISADGLSLLDLNNDSIAFNSLRNLGERLWR